MSEYKPITGELRNSMTYDITTAPNGVSTASIGIGAFCDLCDAIDSVHAALEAECERLRDRDGWVELPKDADGEYIHIGDVMEWSDGTTFEVVGIGDDTLFYVETDENGSNSIEWTSTEQKRHHKPDTWERIIEDAIDAVDDCWANDEHDKLVDALVARCKALAGDAE